MGLFLFQSGPEGVQRYPQVYQPSHLLQRRADVQRVWVGRVAVGQMQAEGRDQRGKVRGKDK